MEVNSNPFEQKDASASKGTGLEAPPEFESLAETVKAERGDFENILSVLEGESNNEVRIKTLNVMKTPYLFSSDQLIQLLHVTPSVKTRIAFIEQVGPRLTDPKAKSQQIIDMFRYSDEKKQVEEILKARAQTVTKSTFSRGKSQSVLSGGGRGRGGRGAGGRGGGGGRGLNKPTTSSSPAASSSPSTGGGRGVGAGRGMTGRGAAGRGIAGRGRGSASTVNGSESNAPSSPENESSEEKATTHHNISSGSSILIESAKDSTTSTTQKQEDNKGEAEESPSSPAWTPPMSVKSFSGPDINVSEIIKPRKSFVEVKTVPMAKRFSRISNFNSNSLNTIGDDEEENDEKSEGEENIEEKKENISSVQKEMSELSHPVRTSKRAERRESSFCASASVMNALGFDDLNTLTTDDIGRESWDVKATSMSEKNSKNIPSGEDSEKLKEIATTTRAREDRIESSSLGNISSIDELDEDKIIEDYSKCQNVSRVKPNRVSLQELQEQRRVLKVKKIWEKSGSEAKNDFTSKPHRRASRRKSVRMIAEEERKAYYASATEEGPIGIDEDTGRNYYSYQELVRRNQVKEYGDVNQTELEEYLTDGEFFVRFNMSKEDFKKLPRWRRVERKRALLLF